jgi:hypothetical protein
MRSGEFAANPIGVVFDPKELIARYEAGEPMNNLGAEYGAVPAHQLFEASGATYDVGELARRHPTAILGESALAVLLNAHLRCSPGRPSSGASHGMAAVIQ